MTLFPHKTCSEVLQVKTATHDFWGTPSITPSQCPNICSCMHTDPSLHFPASILILHLVPHWVGVRPVICYDVPDMTVEQESPEMPWPQTAPSFKRETWVSLWFPMVSGLWTGKICHSVLLLKTSPRLTSENPSCRKLSQPPEDSWEGTAFLLCLMGISQSLQFIW